MNLLFGMDDNFSKYYAVTLKSFLEENKGEHHNIYIGFVNGNLSKKNQESLIKIAAPYNAKIFYCNIDKNLLEGFPVGNWVIESWLRLFAVKFLPEDIDRVLYLDGDVIVIRKIRGFYEQNLEGYYFAGCEDIAVKDNVNEKVFVGLNCHDIYVNGGVLLINLKEMRKRFDLSLVVSWVEEKRSELKFHDQTTLNALFHHEIKICDEFKYNCQIGSYHYKREQEILKKSCILHFVGSRPWDIKYRNRLCSAISGNIWWKYAVKCGYGYKIEFLKWKICNFFYTGWWNIGYRILMEHRETYESRDYNSL